MTQIAQNTAPQPEPVQIDPAKAKADSIASTQSALQDMIAELSAIAADPAQSFTSLADLKSAAALPDYQRDNAAIDLFLGQFSALADAVKNEEEPAWRATVAAKQMLVLPSLQDMVDKYYPKG